MAPPRSWVGEHALHLSQEITVFSNGSGDTTYDYVKLPCAAALAIAIAAIWSAAVRRKTAAEDVHAVLRIYVRYVLATFMLSYGLAKVYKTQFPFPRPERLMEPFGEASPMGLLWTFMGYSTAYNVFTGAAEVMGGALLFFRRTTTLGALIIIAVMTNVVMLNFCYDVPVTLFSLHLFVLACLLVAPDVRRLVDVLIRNRPTKPAMLECEMGPRWMQRVRPFAKGAFVLWLVGSMVYEEMGDAQARGPAARKSVLHGLWDVETFTREGETVPPSLDELKRWRKFAIGARGATVRYMDDRVERFQVELDPANARMWLGDDESVRDADVFSYARPDAEHVVLDGRLGGAHLVVRLRRVDPSQPLVTRGFHWIQEFPFNR